MKVRAEEFDGCFGFDLEPETLAEAALLVRFALNSTKELRCRDTYAYKDGTFTSAIVIAMRANATTGVRPR